MTSSRSSPVSSPELTTDTFQGTVWRHIPPDGHPFDFRYLLDASGRFNRSGEYGALYTALSEAGARAEYDKMVEMSTGGIVSPPRDLVSLYVEIQPVVNLTDPTVRRELGVSVDIITGDQPDAREGCRLLADHVRSTGIAAIRHPSAAAKGEENLVIYPRVRPMDFNAEIEDRRALAL